ncbi:MAG: hypothetical protein ACREOO_32670 [bacterium]
MKEERINNEDSAIRLMLGYLCIANEAEASLVRKVEILDRFGLLDKEIAAICACALQSVRDARQQRKKRAYGKKQKV